MSSVAATLVLPAARPSTHSAGRPVDRAPSGGHLRLTQRGRLVVFLAGLLLGVAVAIVFAAGSVATAEQGEPIPADVIVVGTGVTLWDIASARAEGGDVRDVMATIQQLNHLDGGLLVAGQQLRVPAAD